MTSYYSGLSLRKKNLSIFHQQTRHTSACSYIFLFSLENVADAISKASTFMREQSHLSSLYYLLPAQHSVRVLTGEATGRFSESDLANKTQHQLGIL